MFPIPWNKAFRKKDGTVVNIADAMSGGGGGSDLPPHSAADAGKVLTVGDEGELEWHEAGAGGGQVVLDYNQTYDSGSGSHEYHETVTLEESGTYYIYCGGFCSSVTVKLNDVTQQNYFNDGSAFVHYYLGDGISLSAGDVIDITITSSGKTLLFANVIKL